MRNVELVTIPLGSWKRLGCGAVPPLCPLDRYVMSHSDAQIRSQITVWGGCLHLPPRIEGHARALGCFQA